MSGPHINRIGTALPAHDIHGPFVALGRRMLAEERERVLFDRLAERSGISHRYSIFEPGDVKAGEVDAGGFYRPGAFPSTSRRMEIYPGHALELSLAAIGRLEIDPAEVTHLIVASCTGFVAPGLDVLIARHLGLRADVERTIVGFMGCAAAVPALRLAFHTVRSLPPARALVVAVELCTLHLQERRELETVLSFLLFGDGAAAALVTEDPSGIALEDFRAVMIPDTQDLITWRIGDQGFDMHLSGQVPNRIAQALRKAGGELMGGQSAEAFPHWAVHAGGRTVLDAVEVGMELPADALRHSRAVLRDCGNISSCTVMFVLDRMLRHGDAGPGLAMAFGPGMVAETFRFRLVR